MATVRLHFAPVDASDVPLPIFRGSHRPARIAESNGEIETLVYSDVVTGSNAFAREGFNAMMKECLEGQVAYIVCASLNRLSRSPADFPTIDRLVSHRQIALVALDRAVIMKEGPGSKV
ncbi:recombinase family protein [Sphingomonas solaris]|nr:recombinase family protein [Sphingomonas solaris]